MAELGSSASQFSRYLLKRAGISDKDTNARPGVVKLIEYTTFRAFLASFKKREFQSHGLVVAHRNSSAIYLKEQAFPRIFGFTEEARIVTP
jgi:hypothetical protein